LFPAPFYLSANASILECKNQKKEEEERNEKLFSAFFPLGQEMLLLAFEEDLGYKEVM